MKTREEIITSMCYTMRHDYGLDKSVGTGFADIISSGMTARERETLWRQMAQLFDNDIAPYMEFREWDHYSGLPSIKDYK
jgi:hypothetical protein